MTRYLLMQDGTKVRFLNQADDPEKFQTIIDILDAQPVPDTEPQDGMVYFQWPSEYPGWVTQAFGLNPDWYKRFGVPAHEGLDIRALTNTKIFAVWDGVVSRVGRHVAYGNHIRLHHEIEGRKYETVYAHFNKPASFKVGDSVKKGQVIGLAGSTGNSSGPHLHFTLKLLEGKQEVFTDMDKKYAWNYHIIDPTPFFKELE